MKKFLLSAGLLIAMSSLSAQLVDPATYTPTPAGEGTYTLTNNWIYSGVLENLPATGFAADDRGVAYANGKVYLSARANADGVNTGPALFVIFDAKTGERLPDVALPSQVFKNAEGKEVFAPNNSVAVDSEGRLVVFNLPTNLQSGPVQAWVFEDENDQNPVKLLDYVTENIDAPAVRIDNFSVFGDMKGDGYILGAVAGKESVGATVWKWDIKGGVFTESGQPLMGGDNPKAITIQGYLPASITFNDAAPFTYPISEDNFYLDPFSTYPAIYDMEGQLVDGFGYDNAEVKNAPYSGANGLAEFSINGETFLIAGANLNVASAGAGHIFNLYKLPNTSVAESELLQTFPTAGLGMVSNPVRVVVPRVNVVDNTTAELYIYAYRNGLAKYTFKYETPNAINEQDLDNVSVAVENGKIVASSDVASLAVYTVAGQKVAEVAASQVDAPASAGVYIVKATTQSGSVVTGKVLVQ